MVELNQQEQNPGLLQNGNDKPGFFGGLLDNLRRGLNTPIGRGFRIGLITGDIPGSIQQQLALEDRNNRFNQQLSLSREQQEFQNEIKRKQLERQQILNQRQDEEFQRQQDFRGALGGIYDEQGNLIPDQLGMLRQKFPLLSGQIKSGQPVSKFGSPQQGVVDGKDVFFVTDQFGNTKILDGIQGKQKFTEGNLKAASFANRALEASKSFDSLFDVDAGTVNSPLPDFLLDEQNVLARQYKREFINSVLRRESGAEIKDSEFDSYSAQFFPKAGDSPKIIRERAKARQRAIEGIIQESQGAYSKNFRQSANPPAQPKIESKQDKAKAGLLNQKPANKKDLSGLGALF